MFKQKKVQKWVSGKKNNTVINNSGGLTGTLKIDKSFSNLKSISLKNNKITEVLISGCPQLTEIELSVLTELKNLSVDNCPRLTKLDCSRSQLTQLGLSNNSELAEINCCKNNLAGLDVSDCPNLTNLNCSHNHIDNLILNICTKITKLDCSHNKELNNLEIINCSKLKTLDCSHSNLSNLDLDNCFKLEFIECSNSKLTILDTSNCSKSIKINPPNLTITKEKVERRNFLIIGRTGSGKSTLSNVLSNTEEFEESGYSVSKTKIFKRRNFEWNGMKYRVVDTMGVGDTRLNLKQVLLRIVEGVYSMPEGISQVLFVIDGRFKAEEITAFELFKNGIFGTGILNYVTIVRTKFSNFKNENECKKDKEQLRKENKTISDIVDSCRDVIYVDNPSLNINNDEDDDELIGINKRLREKSRDTLLKYLEKTCNEKSFKLKSWDEIRSNLPEDIIKLVAGDIKMSDVDMDDIDMGCCSII